MEGALDLSIGALGTRFRADPNDAERVLREVHRRVAECAPGIFIHRASLDDVLASLERANTRRLSGEALPLFGIPFAVKDNIDVAGMPTTAACPAFAHEPTHSAVVVNRLVEAGAIVLGKTNLDQFATGLVGVRSPYGACENPFDARYISGGSSSGSAVAVARGLVGFSLGTDTAGSGRVPAALTNVVGLKPTRGLLSTRGVVPACRSLDCVSIFAGTATDARTVLEVAAGFDALDPYSRDGARATLPRFRDPIRAGVPRAVDLEFFGDTDAERLYAGALERLGALGAERVEIDLSPFLAAAELLYGGPWVAERLVAAGALLERDPGAIHPVVRGILEGARAATALDAFRGQYRLRELRSAAEAEWAKMDVLVVPTTPTTYSIAEIEAEPVARNARLGRYTNFVNLFDLAGVAVPAGFREDGLPLGVTFVGPAFSDAALLALAARFRRTGEWTVGATGIRAIEAPLTGARSGDVLVAVAGAHLSGQPLNHQLTNRAGTLVRVCRTARDYRLHALSGTRPPKPGLVRSAGFEGPGIEVEVWALDAAAFGRFVEEVPPPLAIGTVVLDDGTAVKGFVCEPNALENAVEITHHGGWRAYMASRGG
jgi:allophanate hydrolase